MSAPVCTTVWCSPCCDEICSCCVPCCPDCSCCPCCYFMFPWLCCCCQPEEEEGEELLSKQEKRGIGLPAKEEPATEEVEETAPPASVGIEVTPAPSGPARPAMATRGKPPTSPRPAGATKPKFFTGAAAGLPPPSSSAVVGPALGILV
eukprot:GHVS01048162.1.p2 GENE.GHVS01048162.1~~GHVS01048162.1.p2  ORF type:complete len:149 (-),score=32.70 GHVS01048162.1:200-646(-)